MCFSYITVVHFGPLWSYLIHFVHIGPLQYTLVLFGTHWFYFVPFNPIQSILSTSVVFGSFYPLSYSVHISPIWSILTTLICFGPIQSILSTLVLFCPFGPLWSYLIHFVQLWYYSVHFPFSFDIATYNAPPHSFLI